MGFGIISKGVGFLPALMFIPYAYAARQGWSGVVRLPGEGRAWLLGLLVVLAAIATWLLPMLLKVALFGDEASRAYVSEILLRQTARRYANAWHHREPFWYFFTAVIPKYWFALVLALPWLIPAWRRQLAKRDGRYLVLLGWVVLVLSSSASVAANASSTSTRPFRGWCSRSRRWSPGYCAAGSRGVRAERRYSPAWPSFWFLAWFVRGFIEPIVTGVNPRQTLMAQVADATAGNELVLTYWSEGQWLFARQPLVHFGVAPRTRPKRPSSGCEPTPTVMR